MTIRKRKLRFFQKVGFRSFEFPQLLNEVKQTVPIYIIKKSKLRWVALLALLALGFFSCSHFNFDSYVIISFKYRLFQTKMGIDGVFYYSHTYF